ncbi:MAG: nucleotidyltransferase family protein [Chloroflexi bacterium]|nr:nucleotidyltransferase family protein [Chloroflexota bacterium]
MSFVTNSHLPSLEGRIALAATRPDPAPLRSLLSGDVDWAGLCRLAAMHGALPLLYARLRDIAADLTPPEQLASLRAQFILNGQRNLRLTNRLVRVLGALSAVGVAAVPVKGPVLAVQAYGDLALRDFVDLDILIPRDALAPATAVLRALGYASVLGPGSPEEAAFERLDLELPLSDGAVSLDLHWRLTERYLPLRVPLERWLAETRTTSLLGRPVQALTPERTLYQLAINGLRDGWSSLKTIADVAWLCHSTPALDWARLWEETHRAGSQRILGLGLALARDLLGLALPADAERRIDSDAGIAPLVAEICAALLGPPRDGSYAFALYRRARERAVDRLICRMTPNPRDWAFVRLPRQLDWLYYAVRPVRLATRAAAALRRRL